MGIVVIAESSYTSKVLLIDQCVPMYDLAWADRVSEEINESFNSTLAGIKDRVKKMASITQRIVETTACTQCNLKGYILEERPSWW